MRLDCLSISLAEHEQQMSLAAAELRSDMICFFTTFVNSSNLLSVTKNGIRWNDEKRENFQSKFSKALEKSFVEDFENFH